ncbi:hypothetical protein H705_00205 [Bartonella bacilliformis Cond044]|nr:hypothetical protein H705_00205 [Bartonella bacilliformis Cond044]KEG23589.1 hypothetical protein H703_00200 [Bartonella bacilliformis Ver075]
MNSGRDAEGCDAGEMVLGAMQVHISTGQERGSRRYGLRAVTPETKSGGHK